MTSFKFGGSAFSTPVGQRIEKATDSSQASEDWTLIMEICDIINETDEGSRDAVKAIRKRLSNHKNFKSILYTLTLAEACVKNCGRRFHILVASKEFLADLIKILGQKGTSNQCPQIVQEKLLSLIQSWTDAFRNAPDLQSVVLCYEQLKLQGYEFPAQDLDTFSPIYTPQRSIPEAETHIPETTAARPQTASTQSVPVRTFAPPAVQRPQTAPAVRPVPVIGPINPSPEQLAKLRSELDIVQQNARVMSDMLTEMIPGKEDPNDYELLQELNRTCRQMQQRVVELVERVANEEVTGELLRVNDSLNNVFIRYDRFERYKTAMSQNDQSEGVTTAGSVSVGTQEARGHEQQMLIDFNSREPASTTTSIKPEDDEFDMFAQSRSSTFADSRRGGSTYDDNSIGVPLANSVAHALSAKGPYSTSATTDNITEERTVEDDIQDVEEWLKDTDIAHLDQLQAEQSQAVANNEGSTGPTSTDPISSAEFDRFLKERSLSGPERVSSTRASSGARAPRQMQMMASGDQAEDNMYLL